MPRERTSKHITIRVEERLLDLVDRELLRRRKDPAYSSDLSETMKDAIYSRSDLVRDILREKLKGAKK